MKTLRAVLVRIAGLFRRQKHEAEMNEELRTHLEALVERNLAAGMSLEAARRAARLNFGGVEQVKERCRDERGWRWLDALSREVRFSLRALKRAPSFSLTIVVTLALCIGANTAVLSALYSLVLKPLPFPEPGQVVEIYNSLPKAGVMKVPTSVAQYLDYKANADRFEAIALWSAWSFTLHDGSAPARATGARVSADLFSLLKLQPLLGGFFTLEECAAGRDRVVVLTETYWRANYNADTRVLGAQLKINGEPHTIVGVAPRALEAFKRDVVLLKPLAWSGQQATPLARHNWSALMFGRVKSGVALQEAMSQLVTLEERYFAHVAPPAERNGLQDDAGLRTTLAHVRAEQSKPLANSLLLLQAGSLFVLLIGGLNIATLLTVRTHARRTELAIKHSLGAAGRTLVAQVLLESFLLTGIGAALGTAVAWGSIQGLNRYGADLLRDLPVVKLDFAVFAMSAVGSVLLALLTGVGPMRWIRRNGHLNSSRIQTRQSWQPFQRSLSSSSYSLVTGQIAAAFVLLFGTGLLILSYARVIAVDPGFQPQRFVHARVALTPDYKGIAARAARDRILAAVREIPGIEAASFMPGDPMKGEFGPSAFPLPGTSTTGATSVPTAWLLTVTPDFFATLGLRVIEGRGFTPEDAEAERPVLLVDRDFAARHFPGKSAIGQQLGRDGEDGPKPRVIVGVVESARFAGLDERAQRPFVYLPSPFATQVFSMVIRTPMSVAQLAPALREVVRRVDPSLPIYDLKSWDVALDELLTVRRGVMGLLGVYAVLAMMLAALGIYGVLAYEVTRRTREIGVRSAVGATPRQILALFVGQGMWRAVIGVILGGTASFALSGLLRNQLFGVGPHDLRVFVAATVGLLVSALLACWLPARRAARIDPIAALRAE